jgi:hypothetical protein
LVWVRMVFSDTMSSRAMSGPLRSDLRSRSTSSSRSLSGPLVRGPYPMHETRQPAVQWWRGIYALTPNGPATVWTSAVLWLDDERAA